MVIDCTFIFWRCQLLTGFFPTASVWRRPTRHGDPGEQRRRRQNRQLHTGDLRPARVYDAALVAQ